jgi:hypothetical protein
MEPSIVRMVAAYPPWINAGQSTAAANSTDVVMVLANSTSRNVLWRAILAQALIPTDAKMVPVLQTNLIVFRLMVAQQDTAINVLSLAFVQRMNKIASFKQKKCIWLMDALLTSPIDKTKLVLLILTKLPIKSLLIALMELLHVLMADALLMLALVRPVLMDSKNAKLMARLA